MFDWIKNITKESPQFWKNYAASFAVKTNRYVVLSTETTGLNPKKDVIVSIGAIAIADDAIIIADSFEVVIPQYQYLHDNGITNDFLIESAQKKLIESEAMEQFVGFIKNSTLVGHRIHFDIEMINEALDKIGAGRLKNEALDVEVMYKKLLDSNEKSYTIDALLKLFKIPKSDRHSASEEAYTIALLFLKLKSKLSINF
jgi:DNA polymerase III subunit epsilon